MPVGVCMCERKREGESEGEHMDAQGCVNETKFARSCACEWLK